jgi:hypothetical protein
LKETTAAEFTGWGVIEIMGHQKVSGFIETVAYGSTVMFKVTAPEMAPVEQTLEKAMYLNYRTVPAGSVVKVSRSAFETQVGSASVYRMTRCTEEQALSQIAQRVEIMTLAEEPKRINGIVEDLRNEGESGDCDDEDFR